MADLVPTQHIVASDRARAVNGTAGASISVGDLIYLDKASGKYLPADSASTADEAAVVGMAVTASALDEQFFYISATTVDLGAILTQGTFYYLSNNSGMICPFADLGAGDYVTQVGYATSTSLLNITVNATGVAI